MSKSLYQLSAEYETAFLTMIEMDIDEQSMMDTLEGLEGTLLVKMANVGALIKNLEAEAEMIGKAIDRIKAREKALTNKAGRLKDYLKDNMKKAGIPKVKAVDATFTITLLKDNASLKIEDETKLPDKYVIRWCDKTIDNAMLKTDLEAGEIIEGATLDYKPGLRIA